MNKDSASKILAIAIVVVAAILAIGVLTFAGACVHEDGSVSACHQSQTGILIASVVAAAFALVSLFLKNPKAAGALLVIAAIAGAFAAVAPGNVLPLCMMATMHCRAVMLPFAQFMGAVVAALSIIAAIRSFRTRA